MSYRNINVDGIAYKYVVGKTHVKIRGMNAVAKQKIGIYEDSLCDCCGMQLHEDDVALRVFPSHIASYIRSNIQ
jgi:hypothetical protein